MTGAPGLNLTEVPGLNMTGAPGLNMTGAPSLNMTAAPNGLNMTRAGPTLNMVATAPTLDMTGAAPGLSMTAAPPSLDMTAAQDLVEQTSNLSLEEDLDPFSPATHASLLSRLPAPLSSLHGYISLPGPLPQVSTGPCLLVSMILLFLLQLLPPGPYQGSPHSRRGHFLRL